MSNKGQQWPISTTLSPMNGERRQAMVIIDQRENNNTNASARIETNKISGSTLLGN